MNDHGPFFQIFLHTKRRVEHLPDILLQLSFLPQEMSLNIDMNMILLRNFLVFLLI